MCHRLRNSRRPSIEPATSIPSKFPLQFLTDNIRYQKKYIIKYLKDQTKNGNLHCKEKIEPFFVVQLIRQIQKRA